VVARKTLPVFVATVLAALACVYATGYVAFEPKWTLLVVPWAVARYRFIPETWVTL
jgi:hypothetical protein